MVSKSSVRLGRVITRFISITEKIMDASRYGFCFLILNIDPWMDRTLNEWKVSAIDMVKKAMVVP